MSKLQFVNFIVYWHGNYYRSYTTHEACIRQRLTSRFHPTFKLNSLQRKGSGHVSDKTAMLRNTIKWTL